MACWFFWWMGYTTGEIIMVDFAVLNSKSSIFKNRDEFYKNFSEILKVLDFLRIKIIIQL